MPFFLYFCRFILKQLKMSVKESRSLSFIIITVVYALAFEVGLFVYKSLSNTGWHYLWQLFVADVAATVVVWFFGLLFRNVSVYDPYWSVAPPVMLTLWAFHCHSWTSATYLLLIAVWYWGIRLTGNWAFTFKNLNSEDWRYTKYRSQHPIVFHLINLFGLNMMPTLVVFAAMLPGLMLFGSVSASGLSSVSVCGLIIGFLVCIAAATVQLIADRQIHDFRAANPGKYCNVGLWKHGRHPNYFGEISFWWGVWIMYAAFGGLDWFICGPVAMSALFLCISIPLMEKRQLQNKPGYAEYRKQTRMLI